MSAPHAVIYLVVLTILAAPFIAALVLLRVLRRRTKERRDNK